MKPLERLSFGKEKAHHSLTMTRLNGFILSPYIPNNGRISCNGIWPLGPLGSRLC